MKFFYDLAGAGLIQIVVFGCLLAGGVYFFKYDKGDSARAGIEAVKGNIEKMKLEVRSQKGDLQKIEQFKNSVANKERSVNYLLNYLPNELSPVDIFSVLTKEARSAGVDIEDKRDSPVEKGEIYDILKLHVTVKGSFSQVLSFMSRLTDQKWILVVDKVEMRLAAQGEELRANLDIFAFRYKTVEAKAEGAEGGRAEET